MRTDPSGCELLPETKGVIVFSSKDSNLLKFFLSGVCGRQPTPIRSMTLASTACGRSIRGVYGECGCASAITAVTNINAEIQALTASKNALVTKYSNNFVALKSGINTDMQAVNTQQANVNTERTQVAAAYNSMAAAFQNVPATYAHL